ncbi:PhnD/SsuA/transferrin family substrate-binding protein (plasmid) [Photobacterium sp. DA100]|uniref:sensor histidine kinase n=1 Tax=Photobacterium sp. DA100 TaxID=3027472 RepID=UPI0024793345|nr:PhnD/SsuA/transferrin family substrate-binding protein [Photobacterium sp. DA100]WEM45454.1 PhnD/SsuA/transferrin family substrate-binding protein [Photobacterium sp. DA100]
MAEQTLVRIGVLAFNGPAYTLTRWQPTIDYLNFALPDYHFVIVPADIPTLDSLVGSGLIDFTLTNGIQFLIYKYNHQAVKMLNLNPFHGEAKHAIGSALIARADEPEITSLKQLRNRPIVSVSDKAFGGFRVMLREFIQEGVDKQDLKKLTFIGYPQQNILTKVLSKEADFAIAPTCLLERKIRDGTIAANALKVVRIKTPESAFACQTSSQLYPNWTLARMKHVPADYANHIARILLTIPPASEIAVSGLYGGWSVPIDDSAIYQLMDDIGVSIQPSYLTRLWGQYRGWILISAGLVLLFIGYHFRVNYLVHIRSAQLRNEVEQHEQTAKQLEKETNQLYKAQRVLLSGELASGVAHELNQPLMAIGTYASGCRKRLIRSELSQQQLIQMLEKIEQQTLNASQIIQRMRDFMKVHNNKTECISIKTLLSNTLLIFQHTFKQQNIQLITDIDDVSIDLDPILIQQVFANLIQNSIDALKDTSVEERSISIHTRYDDAHLTVTFIDNGCGISNEQLKQLFMPFQTSKEAGLGLGMVICKRIIEAHNGSIEAIQQTRGTRFVITFPRDINKE